MFCFFTAKALYVFRELRKYIFITYFFNVNNCFLFISGMSFTDFKRALSKFFFDIE